MSGQLPDRLARRRLIGTHRARAIREDAGATQDECADALGVHRITFVRWEAGLQRPRGEAAERYLQLLDDLASIGAAS